MKRYLFLWIALTCLLLIAVAAFNVVVDPYGLFRFVDKPGFNSIKPTAAGQGPMTKAYQVLRVQPRGLILGNSRSEVGFDPEHPAWPADARPVFNAALPGTGTSVTLQYLQHVLANADRNSAPKPKVILWGMDFMDFLVDASLLGHDLEPKRENSRLLSNRDGSDNSRRWVVQVKDHAQSTFTLGAFIDSMQTLGSRKSPFAVDLTPLGFNPMRDYLKITADEGYANVFRAKDQANIKAFLRQPKDIFDAGGVSSPELDDMRNILSLCRRHGISLHLVIYPYHARLLEIIRITGHWPAFENWKRAIVQLVGKDAESAGPASVRLWDFSGFNALSTEPVPEKGDRRTATRWYWEAGHFKRELGNLVQDRIFGRPETVPGFGVPLTSATVDDQIISIRSQELGYRQSHSKEVDDLERMAAEAASLRRKR